MIIIGTPEKVLIGNRLILRPIDIEYDAAEWFEVMQVPEMHTWTGNHVPVDIQEVKDVVLTTYNQSPGHFSVDHSRPQTDEMIGIYWIGVPIESGDGIRITFDAQRIARPFWRTGITSEARRLVYQYAFCGEEAIAYSARRCGLYASPGSIGNGNFDGRKRTCMELAWRGA